MNTEFKGNKEDWFIDKEETYTNEYGVLCTVISKIGIVGIAEVYGKDSESKANGQLIADSPLMLKYIIKQAAKGCNEAKQIISKHVK
ncbi:hypothetical protein AAU57_12130 [Nonlabens sp. YIK11]|uniref:hypothetical protein n=1 Tax=Nonlabens sp. YIK11 TaxID=1453349 RepID=UPI0006DC9049|nr:hypothetical protein [Nonlabens sp. YIK11]KQC33995.1 hypothetical protein AAU57_12130 [Nonlabens sp. YIK11]